MSKFIQFTCKGDPRLINVEKIVLIDKAKDGSAQVYLHDSEDTGCWLVDQSYDEVVKAIASNAYVYDAVVGAVDEADDIYSALSKFAKRNPAIEVTLETDHGTVSAKLGECNIYEGYDHGIVFDAE